MAGIDLGERSLEVAVAPQSVSLRLADDVDVSRGDLIAAASDPVPLRQEVTALACWLGDDALRPGARLLVKHGSRTVLAVVRSIDGRLDLDALRLAPTDRLALNDIGRVTVRFAVAAAGRVVLDLAPRRRLPARRPRRRPHPRRRHGGCRGSRRAPAVTLPGRARPHRAPRARGGRRPGGRRRASAPSSAPVALVHVVAPWLCEELEELAVVAASWPGPHATTPAPADLDGAWFVVVGSGDTAVDAAVRADAARRAALVPRRRRWPRAGTAALPATARVTTPDGTVTLAAHAPGDPALAADVARAVDGLLAGGALDLRRRTVAHRAPAGSPSSAAARAPTGCSPAAAASCSRRPTSSSSTGSPRAGSSTRLPATVRVVDVGKAPGRHALAQDAINDLLVEEALAGHAVVRLKGGDPYVLGRGGEERLACEAHGIRVEVVPGRDAARSRSRPRPASRSPTAAWRAGSPSSPATTSCPRCRPAPTTPSCCSWASAGSRARHGSLLDAGRPASCPVAVVERGFPPDQRVTFGTLADIADRAAAAGVENPAVVVVGDVVRLSPDFPR